MKEQLERDIKILREAKQISINNYDFACGVNIKALETQLMGKLQSLDTEEQQDTDLLKESIDLISKAEELAFKTSVTDRQSLSNQFFRLKNRLGALKHKSKVKEQCEFKNKDFHVKVWQDSEKIGIETVWIRGGYCRYKKIGIVPTSETTIYEMVYPVFGLAKLKDEILISECKYSYSDIVTELEKADKLSREVTIWDVIEECKGVTDREEIITILNKYEYTTSYNKTYMLTDNTHYLDDPISFVMYGYQLRLKEEK